jgi:hypothetical protein
MRSAVTADQRVQLLSQEYASLTLVAADHPCTSMFTSTAGDLGGPERAAWGEGAFNPRPSNTPTLPRLDDLARNPKMISLQVSLDLVIEDACWFTVAVINVFLRTWGDTAPVL